MRDIVYNVFDIISYFVQGMLLVNLLKEAQPRFPFKKYHSAAILLGQYVAVQIFLHYSVFIKSLLSLNKKMPATQITSMLISTGRILWRLLFMTMLFP